MKTLKKILVALFATTMVIGFSSCTDDDDGSSVKGMYSFKELDTMRKMSSDNLIKKLTRDGYTYSSYEDIDEDDVFVAYEFSKNANNKRYHIEFTPTSKSINFSFSIKKQQDQKILTSILDYEKKFAGNSPYKISISGYDNKTFYNKEEAKQYFLEQVKSERGCYMSCFYDGFRTAIGYSEDGGGVGIYYYGIDEYIDD